MNLDLCLPVGGRAENLALLGGDGRVALDERRGNPAKRLDGQRERGHVEQQHFLDFAAEHARLNGRANGHDLIRVDALVRLFAEELAHRFLDGRHTGHAADEQHFVDVARLQAGVGQGALARLDAALDQVGHQAFQLGARQGHVQVLGTAGVRRDEGQVDLGLHRRREFLLGVLGGFLQALQRLAILAQVNALLLLELRGQPLDDALVEIVAAQEGVAVGGAHFDQALAHVEDRDVKGAAAQVIDGQGLVALLVHAIGQRRSGWLVDDAHHFQPGDTPGVFGRLALAVVEVRRDGDHRLCDLLAQVRLGILLDLLQDHGRDLRRAVGFAAHVHAHVAVGRGADLVGHAAQGALHFRVVELAAHETLDGEDGVLRVHHRLAVGKLPDQALALLVDGYHRGDQTPAFCRRDDGRLAAFHHGHGGVRRPQVNSYDLTHVLTSCQMSQTMDDCR